MNELLAKSYFDVTDVLMLAPRRRRLVKLHIKYDNVRDRSVYK